MRFEYGRFHNQSGTAQRHVPGQWFGCNHPDDSHNRCSVYCCNFHYDNQRIDWQWRCVPRPGGNTGRDQEITRDSILD